MDPRLLTDIERAVRFLYLQRLAFGGRVDGRTFGVRRDQDSRVNLARLRAELKALRDRLATVTIEQLDFADVIRRYDSPHALFFLDPPYHLTEGYGIAFPDERYEAMAEQLDGISGQFIMSINDTPFIRRTFARFRVDEVDTTWTLSSASAHRANKVTELVFRSAAR